MTEHDRRKALPAGGTRVASGALVTSAVQAFPATPWTWSGGGSVAGSGTGVDPWWVWDGVAVRRRVLFLPTSGFDAGIEIPATNRPG